ncbi:MAG: M56 family metallopeptidase [Bacteroidales bacterium]|nr:M56 family metallopeptidase [Bacteroidales bacterium]
MNGLILYITELNIAITLFFLSYLLFFRRDTNFSSRRLYLLLGVIFSFLVPLVTIKLPNPATVFRSPMVFLEEIIFTGNNSSATTGNTSGISSILTMVFLAGAFLFSVRFLFGLTTILIQALRSKRTMLQKTTIYINTRLHASSFFSIIFINPEKESAKNIIYILHHESQHVRLLHSVDRLLAEVLTIIGWFNPVVWMFKKAVIVNHEYQADQQVVEQGTDHVSYQLTILNQYMGSALITNQFSNQIKKRINMLNKAHKKGSFRKALWLFPVSFILLFFMACGNESADDQNPASKQKSIIAEEEIFYIVEEMPTFNGGDADVEFRKYIGDNLEYPEVAAENGISGRVIVQFAVNAKGVVEDAVIVRSADPALDEEALRVVMASQTWQPGKQKGEKVKVLFTFPINFVLK